MAPIPWLLVAAVSGLAQGAPPAGEPRVETTRLEEVHPRWQDYGPSYQEAPCPFELANGSRLSCGYVQVPEDRTNPESRLIRLAVLRSS